MVDLRLRKRRRYPILVNLWRWMTWATPDQACSESPWAMGWRIMFRPDLWRRVVGR